MKDTYKEIKLTDIVTDGQSVREATDDDHVVELAMSISKHGLLEPIVVEKMQGGKYQLLAGFHRLAAHHRLKKETIQAHIREATEAGVKTIALVENIIRRDMSIKEEVLAVNHLHDVEGLSPSSICDLLGKSREWVNKRLMIPNLPAEVVSELMEGRISISHAEIIGRIQDPGTRAILLNQTIMQKLSARQLEELSFLYSAPSSVEEAVQQGYEKKIQIQSAPKNIRRCDNCGAERKLHEIMLVAVCAHGCLPKQQIEGKEG